MFDKVRQDIYGVFASAEWQALSIQAFPSNFQGQITSTPYVLISILPANKDPLDSQQNPILNGLVILSIYVQTDNGDTKLFQVADQLNALFQKKTLVNGTQLGFSNLKPLGVDSANAALYRGDYVLSFTKFGEN